MWRSWGCLGAVLAPLLVVTLGSLQNDHLFGYLGDHLGDLSGPLLGVLTRILGLLGELMAPLLVVTLGPLQDDYLLGGHGGILEPLENLWGRSWCVLVPLGGISGPLRGHLGTS